MNRIYWLYLSVICLLLPGTLSSQSRQSPELHARYNAFKNDPAMKHAGWSVFVVDMVTGQPVLAHNQHLSLTPASVQKLVTTISALMILGPEYRYITTLQYDGHIDHQGILRGNLYIKGSGDPSFGSSRMSDSLSLGKVSGHFLTSIKAAGINHIDGHIIADDAAFDANMIPRKWLWEDIGNYFGAGSSGLTIHENEFTVFFDAGQVVGEPAKISDIQPDLPELVFVNEVTTGERGSGDQVYIFGAPYIQHRLLTGTVPLGSRHFSVRGSMPDPPLFAARWFSDQLQKNGIAITGQAHTLRTATKAGLSVSKPRTSLCQWHSPTLPEIIFRTNMESVNVYAENIVKTLGLATSGTGSLEAGTKAIYELWKQHGIDISGMRLHDGSGLSPSNRITTELIVNMLVHSHNSNISPYLINSLPVAGRTGSLTNLFRNTPSEGILQAKSGFLGNVRSYAGYTRLKNGHPAAFALIVNDYDGSPAAMRNKMVELLNAIGE